MFFYGWLILISGFLILMISWGCQFSFSVFLVPLTEHFGWPRAHTAGIFSFNILLFGAGSIFSGRLTDRFGPRMVVGIGGALMGGGLILSAAIQNLWQLYLVYGVIIGLGTSSTWGPLSATVSRWFIARRGLVMGSMSLGISMGIVVFPPFCRYLIAQFGWRVAFVVLGLVTGLLLAGASLLLRKDPKELGLNPYTENSRKIAEEKSPISPPGIRHDWSFSDALGTRTYWMILAAYLFWLVGFYMISVHLAAYGTDSGLSPAAAAFAVSLIGAGSILGKVFMGVVSDRVGPWKVLAVNMFFQGLSIFGLVVSGSATWIYVLAALFGFAYGGVGPQLPLITAQFFGLSSLGSIFGVIIFSGHIGAAIGPLLGGKIFDLSQSYFWSFFLGGFAVMISFTLIFLMRPPSARGPRGATR